MNYQIEGQICKVLCKLDYVDLKPSLQKKDKIPLAENVLVKLYFPQEVKSASLMPSDGHFDFKEQGTGYWTISSLPTSKTIVTLEGRLKLTKNFNQFETAMSANFSMRLNDYSLSNSKIESVATGKDTAHVYKSTSKTTVIKNLAYRF